MAAGAVSIGLPPGGRVTMPRQNSAATAYWVGENALITNSDMGTGYVNLSAKKLAVICKVPNELLRFSNPSAEQIVRNDIARVLALAMDKQLLDGVGTDLAPRGLITYTGVGSYTASTVNANGNTLEAQDPERMIGVIENANAIVDDNRVSFIMRGQLWRLLSTRRADSVSAGDQKGPFVFSLTRDTNTGQPLGIAGFKVVRSNQVSATRSKGSASNLTYILAGDFSQYLIAMSGVLEFDLSTQGDTPFQYDQTWMRGILQLDGAPRHDESFCLCDSLVVQ
jgi:HK97 family phage major capsid protein